MGEVAYRLDLPDELAGIHPTFHVSHLRKCLADKKARVFLGVIELDTSTVLTNTTQSSPAVNIASIDDTSSQQDISNEQTVDHNFYFSPDGTKYWIPRVNTALKPKKDVAFNRWEDVFTMYKSYAEKAGFEIRFSTKTYTNGVPLHRYIVFSRNGNRRFKPIDTSNAKSSSNRRNTKSKHMGCGACIRLNIKVLEGLETYSLYHFNEPHNHGLASEHNTDLTRGKRQLDFSDKEFIQGLQSMGFGPTKAHRVRNSLKGGQHLVRGTKDDWKNHIRDVRCFIAEDAQMVINKLSTSSLHFKNNFFEYLAEDGELRSMFWADAISRSNYKLFGGVLAFDATYYTNRYSMIFVPFTGVDCHKKCLTFGQG
ncbi:protein FAR1-RELATED SEQUENCE 5-like [Bidens hawaiensis]|uniref:protein FAR1-RELATED SEQUENCE 5-like n=1 Tax=Bidens hawaiensis TaxID=980011 RepID=UPI00404B8D14